ncbi:ribosomal protein S9/S16-domain-containing protein [Glomus cerebriforme]|uniref:Small ribosomal subunit protein uS9m n=1 Tax=Glomus cerebriforme TaxID=658196 RepID=A0A397TRC5_9GLOM|nr:ribosomal protein S9/S16-domain-containing protein [Glomus cerebriforme]
MLISLTSKLKFVYNVSERILKNNLKSHINKSIIPKSYNRNQNIIFPPIIVRGFYTTFKVLNREIKQNIQTIHLNKYESIDTFYKQVPPESISYFSARPTYNDLIIQLDDLISKYRTAPKVLDKNGQPTLWKLKQHLSEELGLSLKTNQYRIIIQKLNQLNKFIPEVAPELNNYLNLFRRYDPEEEKKRLEAMKTIDQYGRAFALGKRKEAVAQVWVVEGDGQVLVNGISASDYFSLLKDRESILYPFKVTDLLGKYNVWVKVKGGGKTGQAEAIAHGITKALIIHNHDLKPILRAANLVTRDTRVVERKKPGLAKARKRYTWVKR